MITIADGIKTITIDDENIRVTETDCYSFMDWIVNAVNEKHRRVLDRLVLEHTDKNPQKISLEDKIELIRPITLKSAKEKNEEFEV